MHQLLFEPAARHFPTPWQKHQHLSVSSESRTTQRWLRSLLPVMSISSKSNYSAWRNLTVARRIYSLSTGFPDCSKLSTIRVKGDTFSRCDNNLEINSRLCVRRCCNVVGAIMKSFYVIRLLLRDHFYIQPDEMLDEFLIVSGLFFWKIKLRIIILIVEQIFDFRSGLILVATSSGSHVANKPCCQRT